MKKHLILASASIMTLALVGACTPEAEEATPAPAPATDTTGPTVEDARAFIENAESTLAELSREISPIYWEQATNITPETNAAAAEAGARSTRARIEFANATREYVDLDLPEDLQRKLQIIQSFGLHEKGTSSLGPTEPFVSARAIRITPKCGKIHSHASWTLGSIQMEHDVVTSQDSRQFSTIVSSQTPTVVSAHMTEANHSSP